MKLEKLRAEINKTDRDIVLLLARRFKLVRKIAFFKKRNNLPIEDKVREKEIMEKIKQLSIDMEIDSIWLTKIFRLIIKKSQKIQRGKI